MPHSNFSPLDHATHFDTHFENAKVLKIALKTFQQYFGPLDSFFSRIGDPREQGKIDYSLSSLLFTGIFMFLGHLTAVRQIKFRLHTPAGKMTFKLIFQDDSIPHGDTLNDTFPFLDADEVRECISAMIRKLIRNRVLEYSRFLGVFYSIAIDGTGIYKFAKRHCEHCLTKTHDGKTTYYHMVLEAKLVTPDGFAFSIMSEFIENPGENPTKQDCETKAFLRLAPRLKSAFPRLPIVLLMDGMFAEGPVFQLCQDYQWKFLIVLKDLDLSSVNEEFRLLRNEDPSNKISVCQEGIRQSFSWVNGIAYKDTQKRNHNLNVLECLEANATMTKFKWATNIEITKDNATKVASGGRNRWGIETGFDIQKNHGYALKHPYSKDYVGMQVYYYLLQIAHIWLQLVERGNWLKRLIPEGLGSLKNIAFQLLEDWRIYSISKGDWEFLKILKIQIRFDSS